jgi:hypothetical protein
MFVASLLALLLVAGSGVTVLAAQNSDASCDSPRSTARFDSTTGTADFRWWPLGVECTYTRAGNGVDRRDMPGPLPSIWTLVCVGLGFVVIRSFAATRTGRRDEEPVGAP